MKIALPKFNNLKGASLAFLALFIAYSIWGINFVVVKLTLNEIPVMTLAFLRFFLSVILLSPIIFVDRSSFKVKPSHLTKLFLIGLLTVTFHIYLFYEGLARTSAIDASVLSLTSPILSVLGGWWFLKERIYSINLLGTFLGLAGAVIILGFPLIFTSGFVFESFTGNFLIVLSSVVFVIGAIMARQMLKIYSPIVLTVFAFLIGTITFLIPAIIDYINNPGWIFKLTVIGILGLLYITILSTITAFFLYDYALSKVGVIKSSLVQYIQPAISASLAVPFLGERISYSFIIGTCLIILGVYWGTLGKEEHHHQHLKHGHK